MQALQWNKLESSLKLINTKIPTIQPNTVLIKVSHSGVCGTDLHILQHEFRSGDLVILGHEFSGIVSEIGDGVLNVKVGDKVVAEPNAFCDTCTACRRGKINCCRKTLGENIGLIKDGGMAEYCLVPSRYVVKLPESLPMDKAALVEPMACVIHGYELLGQVPDGSKILVVGAGIIGILWINMLHYRGFRNVTVMEVAEKRQKIARDSGLGFDVVNPDEMKKRMEGLDVDLDGFDIVVDCTGNAKAIEMEFDLLCVGATLCIFGCAPHQQKMSIAPGLMMAKELKLIGVNVHPFCFVKSASLVNDMAEKYLDFTKLGIETFTLDQFESALTKLREAAISKAMFVVAKK